MSSCSEDDTFHVFVTVNLVTHPLCLVGEFSVLLFTVKHLLQLWRNASISRSSLICVLGYFSASMIFQIDGVSAWVLTPALNLSRRGGAVFCQTQAFFGWVPPVLAYLFLILFWVERLRTTFRNSVLRVSDKNITRIRVFWTTFVGIEIVASVWTALEMRCSVPSKVMDYNLLPMENPHFCATTKRGKFAGSLNTGLGAVMILMMQAILGYMYVSRLKALFIDSGEVKPEEKVKGMDSVRMVNSERIQRELTVNMYATAVASEMSPMPNHTPADNSPMTSSFTSTPMGSSTPVQSMASVKKNLKRVPKLRSEMTQKELDYFRKSAILALTSSVTSAVALFVLAVSQIFVLLYCDQFLNALLIACSFHFGDRIYDRLFCCCQRVCVATVDRATSMRSAVKNSPQKRPPLL